MKIVSYQHLRGTKNVLEISQKEILANIIQLINLPESPSLTWRKIRSIEIKFFSIPSSLSINGQIITDFSGIANAFAEFLANSLERFESSSSF